ncbi:MAG: hypothetical protein NUV64_01410 [Parcubacteria group bacterium]|nr:hypothetical protein [Parcubacteria group bacterium]MCR4343017.1 hypothetical protein [Patescibacteria group bacterium]
MATYEDFKKIDIKIGKILSAEKIPDTDKLLKLSVDFGEEESRTIVSGIALHHPNEQVLVGKKCAFVTNLEPRVIRGVESNGMVLAVISGDNNFSLLETQDNILEGSKVG